MIESVPLTLKQAQQFVDDVHRHHQHTVGDKYRIGASVDGKLVGVVQVGRPVARRLDDGKTLEVIRLATTGEYNVCSYLYSAAARVAKELGYSQIITYILETEDGASLRASGWTQDVGLFGGGVELQEQTERRKQVPYMQEKTIQTDIEVMT